MSGFVRSEEEIEAIRERMVENRFDDTRQVAIRFRTRESTVDRILPPGLEPTEEPVIRVDVVEVGRSNCVGSFRGAGVYVRAQHEGHVGEYCLTMPMSTEAAITWGRELFGEPKKKAAISLERSESEVSGRVSRSGEPLIETTRPWKRNGSSTRSRRRSTTTNRSPTRPGGGSSSIRRWSASR